MIDPHVHLRDWEQSDKETLAHGFEVAWRSGLSAVFEMPNTVPPLTTRDALRKRADDANTVLESLGVPLFHGMYAGITADADQISEVVGATRELRPTVVGLKLYAGHSTGRMGVTEPAEQQSVWETLVANGYTGVVAVHAESEELLRPDLWDPANPVSHSLARPMIAELSSVKRQLSLADAAGFCGHIHFCHISTGQAILLLNTQRDRHVFSISIGVTPHHALLANPVASRSRIPEWNVNPPLRDENNRSAVFSALLAGEVDWIESDHAPHTLQDKESGASGLPGLPAFRLLVEILRSRLPADTMRDLTGARACRVFGIDPLQIPANPHDPLSVADGGTDERDRGSLGLRHWFETEYRSLAGEYPVDPYRYLELR